MLLARRTQIVVLLAALFASMSPAVIAQAINVVVDGQPLQMNPGPIEQNGRVFVPMRAIFERLGAAVVYNAGTINATKGRTTVSLRIGSTQATVNGQPQILDVAPFIVGATTYVPLRFVAQSLGATVNYESSTRTVSIVSGAPAPAPPPPRPVPPPNPPPVSIVNLVARQPSPDAFVNDRFVRISADFTHRVNPGSVRVYLNGNNVTNRSDVSPTGFSYRPPVPGLGFGSQRVRVTGRDVGGSGFDRAWSFTVRPSGPGPISLEVSTPREGATVGREFVIRGNTVRNARITVTAGQSPSATGQFNGSTTADGRGNFGIQVTVTAPPGQQNVRVRVTARDPVTSRSADLTLQLRLTPLTR